MFSLLLTNKPSKTKRTTGVVFYYEGWVVWKSRATNSIPEFVIKKVWCRSKALSHPWKENQSTMGDDIISLNIVANSRICAKKVSITGDISSSLFGFPHRKNQYFAPWGLPYSFIFYFLCSHPSGESGPLLLLSVDFIRYQTYPTNIYII